LTKRAIPMCASSRARRHSTSIMPKHACRGGQRNAQPPMRPIIVGAGGLPRCEGLVREDSKIPHNRISKLPTNK
jgi:hypothetical protein